MGTVSPFMRVRSRRGATVMLVFAVGMVVLSAAALAYRFTLPTDGWAVLNSDSLEQSDWVYLHNLVGAPSDLRRDDVIRSVNGQSVAGMASAGYMVPPPGWSAGRVATVEVARQGQPLTLSVPIVHWTVGALQRQLVLMPEFLVGLLGSTVLFALALYTFVQRADVPAAHALLVLSAAFMAINITSLLPDGLSVQFNRVAFYPTVVFGYLLFILLLAPSLLAFTLLFPRPKHIVQRHGWLAFAPYVAGLCAGVAAGWLPVVGWLGTQAMVAGSLLSLAHSGWTQRDAVSRAQLQWAGGGLVVGLLLMLLVFPAAAGWIISPMLAVVMGSGFHLGFTVIGATLAIAVLRFRLFDLDLVVNRALVYAVLTACVVGMYVLVVGYLGMVFQREGDMALSLVATGVVAVAFAPLRQGVQRGVNRLMYGERDEPYRVLTRLGQHLETAVEPALALPQTVETVARALKLPYAAITLAHGDSQRTVAAYGARPPEVTCFPLVYTGETIGELVVAARGAQEALTPADGRLLHDLARQIAVAAHAVALRADLEQARREIVAERGEARRRLGSDLHDGVGHRLVAMTRQIEQATAALPENPALAREVLADTHRQLVAVTMEVRGLAHQLFPPELELLGLIEALRERAQNDLALAIEIDAPGTLPPLPAEVETAAYFIALEAITNVQKHAGARTCHVNVSLAKDHAPPHAAVLDLRVVDDGRGIAARTAQGLGLRSMHARAAEVGGTCRVEPRPYGGTTVAVRLPLSSL